MFIEHELGTNDEIWMTRDDQRGMNNEEQWMNDEARTTTS